MSTRPSTQFAETLRPDLAETLEQFDLQANQAGLVGQHIAPVIEVDVPMGQYGVIPLKEFLKNRDTRRQSDGGYAQGDGKGSKDSFETEEHGFAEPVDEREAVVFGDWWDAEQLAAERTRDVVLRNYDKRIVDLVTDTGAITNAAVSSGAWSASGAKPIDDVRAAKIAVRNATGMVPNAGVIEWECFEFLKDCPQIIDRLKYSGHQNPNRDNINEAALAQALGLEEVKVANAMYNSANENVAAVLAAQWPKTKFLLHVKNSSRNTKRPRFANTFHWGADGSTMGGTFEQYYDPSRRRWMIRHRMETDEKLVYSALGYLITGVL